MLFYIAKTIRLPNYLKNIIFRYITRFFKIVSKKIQATNKMVSFHSQDYCIIFNSFFKSFSLILRNCAIRFLFV